MKAFRFIAAVIASFVLTPVLGVVMPLIGLFIAGFAAGAISASMALGAATAVLGSLPWHLIMAKLLQAIAGALGCHDCHNTWILVLVGLAASAAGGAIGGASMSKFVEKR